MKELLLTALLCTSVSLAWAQLDYLPYGQISHEPWTGKYYHAANGQGSPGDNWYAADLNDSKWDEIEGPLSISGSIYNATQWGDTYCTYWIRRHFNVSNPNATTEYYFYAIHDDSCEAYLNGTRIYSNSGCRETIMLLNEEQVALIKKGDNVLAIRVSDDYGGDATLDCGLIGQNESMEHGRLRYAIKRLENRLNKSTKNSNPLAVPEAKDLLKKIKNAYDNDTFSDEESLYYAICADEHTARLDFTYLDITIKTPGSLGDSILSHVKDFADVRSLKLSGKINDNDIYNLNKRMTNLEDINLKDLEMKRLPNSFFDNRTILKWLYLPNNLDTIGASGICRCRGLKSLTLPTTLTTIEQSGIAECDSLKEIFIPEGVTFIGNDAFYSNDLMEYANIPSSIKSISSRAFGSCSKLKKVDFAEGLTTINSRAFEYCSLTAVKMPSTVHFIGSNAFAYNRGLADLTLNEGLYQIEDNAFVHCDSLRSLVLPSTLVLAHASPFDYCNMLTEVTCLSIEPPYTTDQMPYGCDMAGRTLYVPALSINTYKQTKVWDLFPNILPIDQLPENITIVGDVYLTLPSSMPASYKPTLDIIHEKLGSSYYKCGALTVNGMGTLSLKKLQMCIDQNNDYNYSNLNQNYTSLINNITMRADTVCNIFYPVNNRWVFISFPFDVKMSEIDASSLLDGTTNWVVRRYDGAKRAEGNLSDTWQKVGSNEILKAGQGYILQSSRYIGNSSQGYSGFIIKAINNSNKNKIFENSDAKVSLVEFSSEFTHNRSWNLIGNPYPCYYDTRFLDFEAPITVWNVRNNTYTAFSPVDDNYVLCPNEAFFVQCPVGVNYLTFGQEGRQITRTARTLEAPRRAASLVSERTIFNLSLSDGRQTDKTRIVLNAKAKETYEMSRDASKFMSSDQSVPQLCTVTGDVRYSINERPLGEGKFLLSTRIANDGTYTLSLEQDADGFILTLEDKKTGKSTVLSQQETYIFDASAGEEADRFILYINANSTGIEEIAADTADQKGSYYNIHGIEVKDPQQQGFYIKNGKKVMFNK